MMTLDTDATLTRLADLDKSVRYWANQLNLFAEDGGRHELARVNVEQALDRLERLLAQARGTDLEARARARIQRLGRYLADQDGWTLRDQRWLASFAFRCDLIAAA